MSKKACFKFYFSLLVLFLLLLSHSASASTLISRTDTSTPFTSIPGGSNNSYSGLLLINSPVTSSIAPYINSGVVPDWFTGDLTIGNHYSFQIPDPSGISCTSLSLGVYHMGSSIASSLGMGVDDGTNCNFEVVAFANKSVTMFIIYDGVTVAGGPSPATAFTLYGDSSSLVGTFDYWTGNYIQHGTPAFKFSDATAECCSNVLFLPGLEASRLYKEKTVAGVTTEDQLWEPNTKTEISELYLDSTGTSINPSIYTKEIIGTTNVIPVLFQQDIYKSLINKLDDLISTNKITNWKSYAYDWRQGIDDLVQNGTKYNNNQTITLISDLQYLISTSKTGNVTVVTHSNGGLLAKALIKKLEDMKLAGQGDLVDHIDKLIMVASPQLGTPDGMSAILHGYKQTLPLKLMTEIQARKLASNMPSAYGLLPSRKYFEQVNSLPTGIFGPTSPQLFRNSYGSSINSYQKEHDFILGQEGRIQPSETDLISPTKGNNLLLSQAESLHDSIDNMTFPLSMNVINIAGWGKDTIAGMAYFNNDVQPIFTQGDKTVVIQSALYGQGTKYWLDLSNSKLDHKNILEHPQLLDFIKNIIEQNQPTSSNIKDIEPLQVGNRLHLSVHSPVSIGIYDNQGNFTGNVCDDSTGECNLKEDIPGSTYFEFGEGKYVNLSQGNFQKAVLQGTDVGTFTFDSRIVAPDGQTTTSSFIDIPVTTQTQAEVNINQNTGVPELKLDVTGDGISDFAISPSDTFDPISYLQIMKATVDSLDIPQAKKTAFSKRIENIIKSVQKGKVDKAKLKADKFKSVLEKRLSRPDPKHPRPQKLSKTDAQLLLDILNKLLDNIG
ncbi:MAG: hypothetical protein AAB477_00905 [Patescibacteria group bacterium]